MSRHITLSMRDSIARAVLAHRFNDEISALEAEFAALADAVYCDVYKTSERRKMAELPPGWLPETGSIAAQFGDGSHYEDIAFSGQQNGRTFSDARTGSTPEIQKRRVLTRHRDKPVKVYEATHKISERVAALKDRRKDLSAQIETARKSIESLLYSVNTTGKLKALWPEIAPFLVKFDAPPPPPLPAIPIASINKSLRLPAKEAA